MEVSIMVAKCPSPWGESKAKRRAGLALIETMNRLTKVQGSGLRVKDIKTNWS